MSNAGELDQQVRQTTKFRDCNTTELEALNAYSKLIFEKRAPSGNFWFWYNRHYLRLGAAGALKEGHKVECGYYPTGGTLFFFVLFKGQSMCRNGYCYTYIFDDFGPKYGLKDEAHYYLGFTRGPIVHVAKNTIVSSFVGYDYAPSDFRVSGRIRFEQRKMGS